MTVLFSGRFDPVSPGHICSIIRLAKRYAKVKVVVLDYPDRRYPVQLSMQVLKEIFREMPLDVAFVSNDIHFGEISKAQLGMFNFDVYAAGNLKVLRHIERLGVSCVYIDRAYPYAASDITLKDG